MERENEKKREGEEQVSAGKKEKKENNKLPTCEFSLGGGRTIHCLPYLPVCMYVLSHLVYLAFP